MRRALFWAVPAVAVILGAASLWKLRDALLVLLVAVATLPRPGREFHRPAGESAPLE